MKHASPRFERDDFFRDLPVEKQAFVALARRREIRKHGFIFLENDPARSCFFLDQGSVKIFRVAVHGKEPTLFIRHAGEVFGLAEIVEGRGRKCSAQAISDVVLFELARADFDALLARHHTLARRVISVLGNRLRFLGEQIENLMVCDVGTRLLKLLVYLCPDLLAESRTAAGGITLPVSLTQEQMADMTGSCQQTVSVLLKKFQGEGLIGLSGRRIVLLDPQRILKLLGQTSGEDRP